MEHNTIPPTEEIQNARCWSNFVTAVIVVGGMGALGVIGYIIYSIVVVFHRPDDETDCTPVPPLLHPHGLVTCTPVGNKTSCLEQFTDTQLHCSYQPASGYMNRTGLWKSDGVTYDLFAKFVYSYLSAVSNLSCVSTTEAVRLELECCSPYGTNTSICNGVLPSTIQARAISWHTDRDPVACVSSGCDAWAGAGYPGVVLGSINEVRHCVGQIAWGYNQTGGPFEYVIDC